jgi:hypothetical protein
VVTVPYVGLQSSNYAAGDYYNYQAGGIFGFLGKAVGAVAGIAGKVLPGPLGAAAKVVGGVLSPKKQTGGALIPVPTISPPVLLPARGMIPNVPKTAPGAIPQPGFGGTVERILPGGQTGYTQAGGPGWHLNKQDGKYGPAGTYWVRNRSMNPGNARALRRAIRREKAFVSLARRVLKGTGISVSRRSFARKAKARR